MSDTWRIFKSANDAGKVLYAVSYFRSLYDCWSMFFPTAQEAFDFAAVRYPGIKFDVTI